MYIISHTRNSQIIGLVPATSKIYCLLGQGAWHYRGGAPIYLQAYPGVCVCVGERDRERERDREIERPTDRQTDRQAGRQTDRQTMREREIQRERETEKDADDNHRSDGDYLH